MAVIFLFIFFNSAFRFICKHSANIPEVRGHALYYGQDPCAWSSSGAAVHRLRVNHFRLILFVPHVCVLHSALLRVRIYWCPIDVLCWCLCSSTSRPEGTRMIQVMLLKSLVQVGLFFHFYLLCYFFSIFFILNWHVSILNTPSLVRWQQVSRPPTCWPHCPAPSWSHSCPSLLLRTQRFDCWFSRSSSASLTDTTTDPSSRTWGRRLRL